ECGARAWRERTDGASRVATTDFGAACTPGTGLGRRKPTPNQLSSRLTTSALLFSVDRAPGSWPRPRELLYIQRVQRILLRPVQHNHTHESSVIHRFLWETCVSFSRP